MYIWICGCRLVASPRFFFALFLLQISLGLSPRSIYLSGFPFGGVSRRLGSNTVDPAGTNAMASAGSLWVVLWGDGLVGDDDLAFVNFRGF